MINVQWDNNLWYLGLFFSRTEIIFVLENHLQVKMSLSLDFSSIALNLTNPIL